MARTDYVADMEALLTQQLADAEHQMETLIGPRSTGAARGAPPPLPLGDTETRRRSAPDDAPRGAPSDAPASAPAPYARRTLPPDAQSSSQPYGQPDAPPPLAPPPLAAPSAPQTTPGGVAPIPTPTTLAELDERIRRLQQLREWLKDDHLRDMIDDVISKHVQTAARRQAYFSAGVGVVSLIAGWLLSAISPAGVLFNLVHH